MTTWTDCRRSGAAELARVNKPRLTALRDYLAAREAVAFLGAGVSAPLYPLWDGADRRAGGRGRRRGWPPRRPQTCRALAAAARRKSWRSSAGSLGAVRTGRCCARCCGCGTDPDSGGPGRRRRSWSADARSRRVVTTNYDPGIVDARMRVRPDAIGDRLHHLGRRARAGPVADRGRVRRKAELPVLFAHGQHNRPDSIVLATAEYRRAYAGKLPHVLASWSTPGTWSGSGSASPTSGSPRSCARSPTAPAPGSTRAARPARRGHGLGPGRRGQRPGHAGPPAEIAYGAQLILYPAPGDDHSALARLLGRWPMTGSARRLPTVPAPASPRSPHRPPPGGRRSGGCPRPSGSSISPGGPRSWPGSTGGPPIPRSRLVGVTAWGGAGQDRAGHPLGPGQRRGPARRRPGCIRLELLR